MYTLCYATWFEAEKFEEIIDKLSTTVLPRCSADSTNLKRVYFKMGDKAIVCCEMLQPNGVERHSTLISFTGESKEYASQEVSKLTQQLKDLQFSKIEALCGNSFPGSRLSRFGNWYHELKKYN